MRRKSRAYRYGPNKECSGIRVESGKYRGGTHLQTIWSLSDDSVVCRCRTFANVPVQLRDLPLMAITEYPDYRAEKSRPTRRRKRGLRIGRRRSRERHSRRSVIDPAPNSKAPNMRKVNHRRRPERWLIVASERLRVDAKKFVQSKAGTYYQNKRRRSRKLHCLAKWSRLQRRATELGFPPKLAFDTSFFKWLNREFPRVGWHEMDEHALLFTKQPFTHFDPPGDDWRHETPPPPQEEWVRQPQFDPVARLLNSRVPIRNRPYRGASREPRTRRFCRSCGSNHPTQDCPRLRSCN